MRDERSVKGCALLRSHWHTASVPALQSEHPTCVIVFDALCAGWRPYASCAPGVQIANQIGLLPLHIRSNFPMEDTNWRRKSTHQLLYETRPLTMRTNVCG